MDDDLQAFLNSHPPLVQQEERWGSALLRVACLPAHALPPERFVTSVRCVLWRGNDVLVMRNEHETHVLPGGRREPGETLKATLRREVLEETGWAVQESRLIAVLHFHHLAPRTPDYRYPYPDFLQVVYLAEAATYQPEALLPDDYERHAAFMPLHAALNLNLNPINRALLQLF